MHACHKRKRSSYCIHPLQQEQYNSHTTRYHTPEKTLFLVSLYTYSIHFCTEEISSVVACSRFHWLPISHMGAVYMYVHVHTGIHKFIWSTTQNTIQRNNREETQNTIQRNNREESCTYQGVPTQHLYTTLYISSTTKRAYSCNLWQHRLHTDVVQGKPTSHLFLQIGGQTIHARGITNSHTYMHIMMHPKVQVYHVGKLSTWSTWQAMYIHIHVHVDTCIRVYMPIMRRYVLQDILNNNFHIVHTN